jgi:hypothetical protein
VQPEATTLPQRLAHFGTNVGASQVRGLAPRKLNISNQTTATRGNMLRV